MCGINGIISKHSVPNLEARIAKMNEALAHRGPNANKHRLLGEGAALGHRRLSILDLDERANQPMQLADGKMVTVFNGEIFNFKEIRQQLESDCTFRTESDTEVLLAAIERRGIEWFLARANGMFAFAVYDTETRETLLCRDRFGIKPLFYTVADDGTLIFSSEIKGILASGLVQPAFNHEAIDDYLANRYTREPYTFFRQIFQMKPATYVRFDAELNARETTYWQLPALNFEEHFDAEAVIARTDEEIQKAFRRWFIADVRVGAYLSGGVDSSLTTALLSQYANQPIDTYTIGFDEEGFNEFGYAQKVADKYHTRHHALRCDQRDYFDEWERLVRYKDAPLAVPNEIPLAQMSSALSKDMTVVISGEGADELFGGYGRIFRAAFDYANEQPQQSFYQYFIRQYEYVPRELRDRYLRCPHPLRTLFDEEIGRDFGQHRNEENIFRFFHGHHIQGLLQRVDMTTMQTSVEARPPFLDHELIEFAYTQVPYALKLHWNSDEARHQAARQTAKAYSETLDCPKYVLKKVAERYLPADIIYRKKMGFPVPLTRWFPDLNQLSAELLPHAEWLDTEELRHLTADLERNPRAGQLLWMFINVQLFYTQYFKKNWLW